MRLTHNVLVLLALGAATGVSSGGPVAAQGLPPSVVPQDVPVAELVVAAQPLPGELLPTIPALAYPLALPAEQVDPWGWRYSDSRAAWRMHTGVDFAAPSGTPVLSALPGQVVLAEEINGYGLTVIVDHGQGLQTLYAHLQSLGVAVGTQLNQGDVLGLVGMTGRSTGPHLHFELRRSSNGQRLALDPTPHLPPLLPPPPLTAAVP